MEFNKEQVASAMGRNVGISTKQSIELCNHLRYKTVEQAKRILDKAIAMERAVPFKRFTNGLGHKPGMAAGRYIPKTAAQFLKVIDSAVANAENKGLTGKLTIVHISAQQAARPFHYGRQRRSRAKQSHITVVVGDAAVRDQLKKKTKGAEQ